MENKTREKSTLKGKFRTGMTAIDVVAEIVKSNPTIKALAFFEYEPIQGISELPNNLSLARVLLHRTASGKEVWLKREEMTVNKLYEEIGYLEKEHVLSVLSKVVLKQNKVVQIPMMDFTSKRFYKEPVGHDQCLRDIKRFFEEAGYGNGVILDSGRSFHYYGNYLMSEKEWRNFLGDCLLSGVVNPRYIGHCEKDGYSGLRLSLSSLRPVMPRVVSVLS